MKKNLVVPLATVVVLVVLVLLWRRAGTRDESEPGYATMMTLTGTAGNVFNGFYIVDGKRVEVSGVLPWSLSVSNVSRCEFRKADTNAAFVFEARGGQSMMSAPVREDDIGIKADLEGGWNFEVIR